MPCAFRMAVRPSSCGVSDECYFSQHELIEFEGQSWCQFHLPSVPKKIEWLKHRWGDSYLTKFNDEIFAKIESDRDALLVGVVFPGDIDFGLHAKQVGQIQGFVLAGSVFHGNTSFRDIVIPGRPGDLSVMGGMADFTGVTFNGTVDFRNTTFAEAYFVKTRFSNGSTFARAQFGRFAHFDKAIFQNNVDFRDACFFEGAIFSDAEFQNSETYFERTEFKTFANFYNTKFFGAAWFSGSGSFDELNGSFRHVSFAGVEFRGPADFSDRCFTRRTDFSKAKFQQAPKFFGSQLHQETKFQDAEFFDISSESAVEAYRTLKVAMASTKARDDEGRFFALEQKSLRKRKDTPILIKLLSTLYEATSDYGRSPELLIKTFLFVTAIFTIGYYVLGQFYGPVGWQEAFSLSTAQIFKPFEIIVGIPKYAENSWVELVLSDYPGLLRIACGLQSLLSVIFIALFLLALRWRFMRE